MAINLFANQLNAKVAITTKTWSQLGFDSSTISIVYLLDAGGTIPISTWRPNDPFSQLTGIERNRGYLIQPKINLDREEDFIAPIPITTTTTTSSTTTTTTTVITTTTSSTTTSTSTNSSGARIWELTGDSNGRLTINGTMGGYSCGDIIWLVGNIKSVEVLDLHGCNGNLITITNKPGTILNIGDPLWNNGAFSYAFNVLRSSYLKIEGENKNAFVINGSAQDQRDAYFDLNIRQKCHNIEVGKMTINNGGGAVTCKTDPESGDPQTYFPTTYSNFKFYEIDIVNAGTEGFYIGHTSPSVGGMVPCILNNVEVSDCFINTSGQDGIQIAACNVVSVHHNEVTNWAFDRIFGHVGGILIGGRVTNSITYCNHVHDGWGELMQIYADGANNSYCIVDNNLFDNNGEYGPNDGISVRGTNGLVVRLTNNTISKVGNAATRWNGFYNTPNTSPNVLNNNVILQPAMATQMDPKFYIYVENSATIIEGTGLNNNLKLATVDEANVDENNFYIPNPGSPAIGKGYVHGGCSGGTTTTSTTIPGTTTTTTSSTTTTSTTVITTTTSSTTTTSTTNQNVNPQFSTTINGWNAYVKLPDDYFVNLSNTYPLILFIPGLGEVGTDISKLLVWGPAKFIAGGWSGVVNIDGTPIQPIHISLQPTAAYPIASQIDTRLNTIFSTYRVNRNKVHLTGISHGGWCIQSYLKDYYNNVTSVVPITSVEPADITPYPQFFNSFVGGSGRWLGFEQVNDPRNMSSIASYLNSTIPNSAIYKQTNFGNGGHCCWDNYYSPSAIFSGLDGRNENIYQWMIRQNRVFVTTTTTTTTTTSTSTTSSTTTTTTSLPPDPNISKFAFTVSSTYSEPGWIYLRGNPQTQSISGTQNGITVTNNQIAWQNINNIPGDEDGGMSTGTFIDFPPNVVRGNWLNYQLPWYGADYYGIIVTGLEISSTYNVKLIGSIKSTLEPMNVTNYRLVGNGDENFPVLQSLNNVNNTSNYVIYNNITPDGTGRIRISVNSDGVNGSNFGYIGGMIIEKNI